VTVSLSSDPHHDGSALYVSNLDPELGESVRVRVRVPDGWGATRVRVRVRPDGEPFYVEATRHGSVPHVEWWEAAFTVENPQHPYRFRLDRGDGTAHWLNARGLHRLDPRDADDFRIVAGDVPPAWSAGAVMYQVFPDRFARSATASSRELPEWAEPAAWTDPVDPDRRHTAAQFYGGDLGGVEERLDHIQGLGADIVYLTPVFPARSNHRYDALSFEHVDPLLGGDGALISLVEAAHGRGMRVLGDLTTNHCGDAHEWFQAAYGTPGAPESEFFYWLDAEQLTYVSWLGVPSLPKFNWNSAELRRRFIEGPDSVVAKWLGAPFHLDGWRIDVANMTGRYRTDDLNPEVRRIIRRTMTEVNPDTLLLGEFTGDAAADFAGDAWHGAMTYANFTRPVWNWLRTPGSPAGGGLSMIVGETQDWDGSDAVASHREFVAGFPWRVRTRTMNALDTHDIPRFVNDARDGAVPVAVGLAMTMPGLPVIWQGDEFGLTGSDGEDSRTPLPWDSLSSARDRIALYSRLASLRDTRPELAEGGLRWLHASAEAIAFAREAPEGVLVVVAARSAGSWDVGVDLSEATPVVVEGSASVDGSTVTTTGAAFVVWDLEGATAPAWD
jgi:alpha-glucosidase